MTRVSAPLGIDVRVDAGCVDVFGINGMPPVVTFGLITSFRNTFKPIRTPFIVVRMGPAIFVRVPELVTRFKGIFMARPNPSTGGFTDPTKSIRRRKTGMFNHRRGNDKALRRGGFSIPQPDCTTRQPEQHHTRTHNRHRPPLRTRIDGRWWKVGGNEGNRRDISFSDSLTLVKKSHGGTYWENKNCLFQQEIRKFPVETNKMYQFHDAFYTPRNKKIIQ